VKSPIARGRWRVVDVRGEAVDGGRGEGEVRWDCIHFRVAR
jgi:hypothetical protein